MKQKVTILLILALVFGFAVCGCGAAPANTANTPADETPAETEVPAATEAPEAEKKAVPDEDAQISLIFSLLNSFRQDEKADKWSYTVTDLDHDGNLELVAASHHPEDRSTNLKVWEVSESRDSLIECNLRLEEEESFPDILTDNVDTYHDVEKDIWSYMVYDNIVLSDTEVYTLKCAVNIEITD